MKNTSKVFLLLSMWCVSCQDGEQISPEQRYIADTLYSRELTQLRLQGDSLCKIYRDSFYQKAVDSLQDVYLDELDYYFRK